MWFTLCLLLSELGGTYFYRNTGTATRRLGLKVHCHAFQCFYVDFFFLRSKMAARRLEAAAPTNESLGLGRNFFSPVLYVRRFAIDRRRSISQLSLQSHSSLSLSSRTKLGFEIWSRKWKDKFAHQQSWKIRGIQNRLAELHGIDLELSWSDDRSRLTIFQVQLCIFRYTVQCTLRQSTGKTLVERASFGKIHGRHYFPRSKMAQKITE